MLHFAPKTLKPARWNVQPRLTAAPALWRGAVVWPFTENAGRTYAANRTDLFAELNSASCFWSSAARGTTVECVGGGSEPSVNINSSDPSKLPLGDDPLSVTVVFRATSFATGNDANTLFALRGYDNEDNGYSFRIENSGELWFRTFGGNNGGTSAVVNLNQFHAATAAWTPGSGVKIYLDGALIQNDTTLTDGNPTNETNPRAAYGVDWSTATENFGDTQSVLGRSTDFLGHFYLGVNHFRALSDNEVTALHHDPFALIRPGPQALPLLFGGVGATGGFVSLSGASAATTALSGRLSASRTIQGLTAATTTTSGSLSALRAVTGSADAQTSVQGALAANRGLAGTSAAQTTTAGRVSIRRAISGAVTVTTTLTGALFKSARVLLSGTATAVTSLSGRLSARRGVSGAAPAQTTMTARIGIRRAVSAVAQATTTTVGALSIRRAVSGVVNVVSTLTGALSISAATKRFSAVGRTRGKLRSGRTRGKLRFSGKTKGK